MLDGLLRVAGIIMIMIMAWIIPQNSRSEAPAGLLSQKLSLLPARRVFCASFEGETTFLSTVKHTPAHMTWTFGSIEVVNVMGVV